VIRAQPPRRARALAVAASLGGLAAAIALPPARTAWLGLAPGDVTLALRFALMAGASLAAMAAIAGSARQAVTHWLCVLSPALMFFPGLPSVLAPFGLVPFYLLVLRCRSSREAALVGALAAHCQVLGAAGWIFHYFRQPLLPGVIAFAIAGALWAPLAAATRALGRRSPLGLVLAASFVPLTEVVRGEWMRPPLPGLLMAHATADTALTALARCCGEAGIAFVVAGLGAGGALLVGKERTRLTITRRLALLLGIGAALAATDYALGAQSRGEAPGTNLCAVADPTRTRGRPAFGDGGAVAIVALAAHAEELGCEVLVFPEYSVELEPRQIVAADWGLERARGPVVLGGASIDYRQPAPPRHWLRNVACRLHLGPERQINCAGAFDKLVFAPFGEAELFQDSPTLSRFGAWISLRATRTNYAPLRSLQPVGLLPLGDGKRAAAAICWEVLVPRIFERRGVRGRGDVDLLVVLSDLDGFGGSAAAIEQFRRASVLHAVRLDAPLLFASTNDPFLVTARGELVAPVLEESFVTMWEAEM
jgi:hypothetical protein